MRRNRATVLAAAGLIGLSCATAALGGCVVSIGGGEERDWSSGWNNDDLRTEERQMTVAALPAKPVHVRTMNGAVSVKRADVSEVKIKAKVRARDAERLAKTQILAERDADGMLKVSVKWADDRRKNNEGVSFEIQVPDADGVDIDTSNGSVAITGLSGRAVLETSNGGISASDHGGDVRASTSNGGISMTGVRGSIDVESSNGGITIKDAGGAVTADTSNGAISVHLGPASSGPVKADTSNGTIELIVGPSFAGTVRADTSNAAVDVDVPGSVRVTRLSRTDAQVQFAAAGPGSVLDTSNGRITITQR